MLEPRAIAANEKLLASTADSWYGAVFSERRTAIIRCQVHRQEGEGMRRWRRDAARETTAKKRKTRTRDPKFGPRPRPREKTHLRAQYIKEIRVTERITIRRWPTSSIRCASNAPPVIRRATSPRDNLMFAPINKRARPHPSEESRANHSNTQHWKFERPKRFANYASFFEIVGRRTFVHRRRQYSLIRRRYALIFFLNFLNLNLSNPSKLPFYALLTIIITSLFLCIFCN